MYMCYGKIVARKFAWGKNIYTEIDWRLPKSKLFVVEWKLLAHVSIILKADVHYFSE